MAGLRRVAAGDKLRIPAADWNSMIDAAAALNANRVGTQFGALNYGASQNVVVFRNDTEADLERGQIIHLDDVVCDMTVDAAEFLNNITFKGVVPPAVAANFVEAGQIAVVQEFVEADKIGRAVVSGLTIARVKSDIADRQILDYEPESVSRLVVARRGLGCAQLFRRFTTPEDLIASEEGASFAVVRLGVVTPRRSLVRFTANEDIAAGDTGEIDIGEDDPISDASNAYSHTDCPEGAIGWAAGDGATWELVTWECPPETP